MSELQPSANTSRVKRLEVVFALEKMALHLGPGGKFPTVRELAQTLGVALATLDHGLRTLEQKGMIIRQQGRGIYVSSKVSTKRVGFVFGQNIFTVQEDHFYRLLLQSCVKEVSEHNLRYSVFFDIANAGHEAGESYYERDDLVFALQSGRLDGLILTSAQSHEEEARLREYNVPLVSLTDSELPGSVCIDNSYMIHLAAGALHAEGCRTLGFIMGTYSKFEPVFRKIAPEMGFKVRNSWLGLFRDEFEFIGLEQRGCILAEEFLAKNAGKLPDGLIIANDLVARGFCRTLSAAGVVLGRDIKIASHANAQSPVLSEWEPQLLLCQIQVQEVARALVEQMESLMSDEKLEQPIIRLRPHLKTPQRS